MRVSLCQQLHLLPLMSVHVEAEKTLYRYRHVIRTYLDIKSYEDGGKQVVETAVQHAALGQGVRDIFKDYGGAEALRERYEQVSAYHNHNYRPLMWGLYSPYRAELFRLSHVLTFRAATHDQSLMEALHFIQRFQHVRRDHLPAEIALDFASVRWQALIRTRRHMPRVRLPSASLSPILGFQERTAENLRSASNTHGGRHDTRRGCYGQSFAGSGEQRRPESSTGRRVAYRAGPGPRGAQPGPGR